MKQVELNTLNPGDAFKVAGREYVVLDKSIPGSIFVLESKSFTNVRFGKTNDWRASDIREYLNGDYLDELLDNGLDNDAILPLTIDLKETNGGREYGYDICRVGLLTLEQYTKYAEYIPLYPDNGWWLATPCGTPNGRSPYTNGATYAWFVYTNGYAGFSYCTNSFGIRPALRFTSDLLVSVEGEDEEATEDASPAEQLEAYSEKMLLDELARRAGG